MTGYVLTILTKENLSIIIQCKFTIKFTVVRIVNKKKKQIATLHPHRRCSKSLVSFNTGEKFLNVSNILFE